MLPLQSPDSFIRAAFPSTPSVAVAQMEPAEIGCSCTAELPPVAPNESTTKPRVRVTVLPTSGYNPVGCLDCCNARLIDVPNVLRRELVLLKNFAEIVKEFSYIHS
ncbi:unnamed protein product [Leuciscus chuanchicus]